MPQSFRSCSKYISINNYNFHYHERKGTGEKSIVFLHGYPTSSLDYEYIWDLIPMNYSIIVHDHLGFGKSDKPINYSYSIKEQADYALAFYSRLGLTKIHLVAHDYGTSIATEMIARHNSNSLNIEIEHITLCNGSMLIDMARLRLIQHILKNKWLGPFAAKFSTSKIFHRNMKNIWWDATLYNPTKMQEHWNLLISNDGRKVLSKITRYINQRYANYDRWVGALENTEIPITILWAANDPIAVVEMANKLETIIPNNTKSIINNCGHYPMLEQPKKWVISLLFAINN